MKNGLDDLSFSVENPWSTLAAYFCTETNSLWPAEIRPKCKGIPHKTRSSRTPHPLWHRLSMRLWYKMLLSICLDLISSAVCQHIRAAHQAAIKEAQ